MVCQCSIQIASVTSLSSLTRSTTQRVGLVRALKSRLKASVLRDAYWALGHRDRLRLFRREVDFYRLVLDGFSRGDLIFDVGANVGGKTDVFLRLGARVVAVEPDRTCAKSMEERFLDFRLNPRPVTIVTRAVSDRVGSQEMLIDGPGSAVNTMSPKWAESLKAKRSEFVYAHCGLEFAETKVVETITLAELIVQHGVPFFVKIDVEGHEASVLRGLHQPVPYLSFEVNLPEFRAEGMDCVRILEGLDPAGRFNYTADCTGGLTLTEWVSADVFCALLDQCSEGSIEVFWKNHRRLAAGR